MSGRAYRRFSPGEDRQLAQLRLQYPGCTRGNQNTCAGGLATIARKMGRAKTSVRNRLRFLAAREEG